MTIHRNLVARLGWWVSLAALIYARSLGVVVLAFVGLVCCSLRLERRR